jgi:hypothetical protein
MAWVLDLQAMDIYTEDTVQGNLHNAFEPPYPVNFWYVTDTPDVTHDGALNVIPMGAFFNTPLRKIVIPSSVTSIGPESFQQTALTEVTIPNNQCTYYTTSFPPNCVVTGGHLIE